MDSTLTSVIDPVGIFQIIRVAYVLYDNLVDHSARDFGGPGRVPTVARRLNACQLNRYVISQIKATEHGNGYHEWALRAQCKKELSQLVRRPQSVTTAWPSNRDRSQT